MNATTQEPSKALIEFKNVSKRYGALAANDELSFQINSGIIHAIIGENGAGKTTAMKLLFGLEEPTQGEISYRGIRRPWLNPKGAIANGLGMVHQHFMLSSVHSALDNTILGREYLTGFSERKVGTTGWMNCLNSIERAAIKEKLEVLARNVGFKIPWDQLVANLPVGIQQQLEIIKLLYSGVNTMILDEPTAVLSPKETESFLGMLQTLKQQGKTIVLITHKLREVKAVADVVTIFRRGKSVLTESCHDLTIQKMADAMVGRHVSMGELPRGTSIPGELLIDLENITVGSPGRKNYLTNLSLKLSQGEIVGVAGVDGSGQRELWDLICGPKDFLRRKHLLSGRISLFGKDSLTMARSDVREQLVAIVPADRLREAVLAKEDLVENDLLGHEKEFLRGRWPFFRWLDRKSVAGNLLPRLMAFDVRPPDERQIIGRMSGGNQQKFVMSRELARTPKLILCAEPTRGVDVGSIEFIHGQLLKHRDEGSGILLVSSQLDELIALSDRIVVMFDGRLVAEFGRGNFSESAIGAAMGGAAL